MRTLAPEGVNQCFNGYVPLRGSVSSGKAGEQVVIRQKPQGSDASSRSIRV